MKLCIYIILFFCQLASFCQNEENKPLIKLIDSITNEDQTWRGNWRKYLNNEIDTNIYTLESIQNQINKTDSLNYFQIKSIIKKYGYPTQQMIGKETANNFWLLIQHQDKYPYFQDSVLVLMKSEVDKGSVSAQNYAYLLDRVKVNTGQLQIYGTQMKLNAEKTSYEPKPVFEIEELNERRKTVGLPSEEEYIEMMNKKYFGTLNK